MNDYDPRPIMRAIDGLSPAMRALVYEYGFQIVAAMINEGYGNPIQLRKLLESWRESSQEKWLSTDFITPRSVKSIVDAVIRRAA